MEKVSTIEQVNEAKFLLEKIAQQWGGSIAEVILESNCNFFRVPNLEGGIGYRVESGFAIVFGDPICPRENIPSLIEAFHRFAKENHLNVVYIIASESFARWAMQHHCNILIEVGEELIFDPQRNPIEGPKANRLRNKVNHALRAGIKVKEYHPIDETLEEKIKEVGIEWLSTRKGPQIHLGKLNFFENRNGKRWFYVEEKDQIIGAALLSRLEAFQGWLLKFSITLPSAPRGTSELLMTSILETLGKEGCQFLTYGIVPAKQLGEMMGIGKFPMWLAQKTFQMAKWLFRLDSRKIYWQKFQPKTARSFVLLSTPRLGLKEIRAILKALKIDF